MSPRHRWLWAVGLALIPTLAAGGALLAAEPTPTPSPSAFRDGAGDLGALHDGLADAGLPVHAAVADLSLAANAGTECLWLLPDARRGLAPHELAALEGHLAAGGSAWVAGGAALAPWLARQGLATGTQALLQAGSATPQDVTLAAELAGATFAVASALPGTLLVEEGTGWQVWLTAPAGVHLDLDGDKAIGAVDPPGPFPVGASLAGPDGGSLLVTADASLLADPQVLEARHENLAAVRAIVASTGSACVVIDESQHGWTAAESPWATLLRASARGAHAPLWALAASGLAFAAGGAGLLLRVAPLRPFAPHRASDLAQAPAPAPADVQPIAWDLLAERTGRPAEELRAGGLDAAQGLADDPALRRVLLGRGSPADERAVLDAYLRDDRGPDPQETNP